MNLKTKWHLKEYVRLLLSIPFSLTMTLSVFIVIRMNEFRTLGLDMYPGLEVPKHYSLEWALNQFWDQSLSPLLLGFAIAIPLDVAVRRLVLMLNEAE